MVPFIFVLQHKTVIFYIDKDKDNEEDDDSNGCLYTEYKIIIREKKRKKATDKNIHLAIK